MSMQAQRYIFNVFTISAIQEGGWPAPRHGRFNPQENPVPIVYEDGCACKVTCRFELDIGFVIKEGAVEFGSTLGQKVLVKRRDIFAFNIVIISCPFRRKFLSVCLFSYLSVVNFTMLSITQAVVTIDMFCE
jgi:hypothetical protein